MTIKQQAMQAGFKGLLGNTQSGYILLTEHTNGQAGRRLFIKAELAPKFKALVEESKENYVLHQLSQLRALAGGTSSYSNLNDPKEHKTRLGVLEATYFITQQVTNGLQPGVHITDIDFGLFGKGNLPGLYKVEYTDEAWRVSKRPAEQLDNRNAAINGLSGSLEEAGQRIMPPMVEHAYGRAGDNRNRLHSEGFTLFYSPQSIKVAGKQWRTPEQKRTNHKFAAQKLAKVMQETQTRKHKTQWTIHGNGSALLKAALEQLPGKKLDQHEVMFMAPEDLSGVLPLMKKAGVSLHGDVMLYSDAEISKGKLQNQTLKANQVAHQLRQFGPQHHSRADEIAAQGAYNRNQLLARAIGLAIQGVGTATQALTQHGVRNTAASLGRVTDPSVNPHLNPHKTSRVAFNQHAKAQTGGVVSSYKVTFKALLKQLKV